jgi:hypothetical protein|uniref:Uncharacterized protein n=1 Tax=Picea glauca TaxID=3330 RepID=A0A101M2W3_PICGL|nr:hypothetical protein ABT39_MTgene3284 [Picea glauca]QHR89200.1 hypothetical protein Q903MT_gene3220 [Picea sitchensis]
MVWPFGTSLSNAYIPSVERLYKTATLAYMASVRLALIWYGPLGLTLGFATLRLLISLPSLGSVSKATRLRSACYMSLRELICISNPSLWSWYRLFQVSSDKSLQGYEVTYIRLGLLLFPE